MQNYSGSFTTTLYITLKFKVLPDSRDAKKNKYELI